MVTERERELHTEHEAWYAATKAAQNRANIDYNIMMGNLEDPNEEEEDDE